MVRSLTNVGMFSLLTAAWLVFEVQNVWPFNDGRVEDLRLMFAMGASAAAASFAWCRPLLLPSAFLAVTFIGTSTYSHAVVTPTYVSVTAGIVVLIAALKMSDRGAPNVRNPPIADIHKAS